jgi:hypothetical protein
MAFRRAVQRRRQGTSYGLGFDALRASTPNAGGGRIGGGTRPLENRLLTRPRHAGLSRRCGTLARLPLPQWGRHWSERSRRKPGVWGGPQRETRAKRPRRWENEHAQRPRCRSQVPGVSEPWGARVEPSARANPSSQGASRPVRAESPRSRGTSCSRLVSKNQLSVAFDTPCSRLGRAPGVAPRGIGVSTWATGCGPALAWRWWGVWWSARKPAKSKVRPIVVSVAPECHGHNDPGSRKDQPGRHRKPSVGSVPSGQRSDPRPA